MNKKLNKVPSARTKADSEQKAENMQFSQHNAKPNVVRSPKSLSRILFFKINIGHFVGKDPIKTKPTKSKNLSKKCSVVKSSIKEYFVNNNKPTIASVK